jgi:hypothetical protein
LLRIYNVTLIFIRPFIPLLPNDFSAYRSRAFGLGNNAKVFCVTAQKFSTSLFLFLRRSCTFFESKEYSREKKSIGKVNLGIIKRVISAIKN